MQANTELKRLSDRLHIPASIKKRGAVIYRKALDAGLVKGRSIAEITTAALYAACRSSEIPRTLKEVAEASNLKRKDIARCYRLVLTELNMKMPVKDPLKSISKIASKVKIPVKTQRKALNILNEAKKKGVTSGKDPTVMAAASLYLSCTLDGVKRTQRDIAQAANVTEVTVRSRYKILKSFNQAI
jgi:transcription initiation factor TFIIB